MSHSSSGHMLIRSVKQSQYRPLKQAQYRFEKHVAERS